MSDKIRSVTRRQALKGAAAGVAAAATLPLSFTWAMAAPRTIKIGLVQPTTGPLAFFTEHIPFVLDQVKKTYGGSIDINGTKHPYEIIIKDSQSNPNRAAEVAQELILQDNADIVAAFATPETVNPVADQCEVNGVPLSHQRRAARAILFRAQGRPEQRLGLDVPLLLCGRPTRQRAGALLQKAGGGRHDRRAVAERRRRDRAVRQATRHAADLRKGRLQGDRSRPVRHAGE